MAVTTTPTYAEIIPMGEFEAHDHYYPKALNATIHPMIAFFLNLDSERIIKRYCHLHPKVEADALRNILQYQCKYFKWAGADLLNVTTAEGNRRMVIIENNSCPSGQKSMPLLNDENEQGGYKRMLENTFMPLVKSRSKKIEGGLAVVYDKNPMEAKGYARTMADLFKEEVYYVYFDQKDEDPPVRFTNGIMEIRQEDRTWKPIRAAFRYLTQRPWNRLPVSTKTKILNPVVACLAGGRNKMVAAKSYDFYNSELRHSGLRINTPETIWDVSKNEIPLWVARMGGQAVVKVPYSNAGQGVYTIVNQQELDDFMELEFPYDRFIVQSLIGNFKWSSTSKAGKFFHVGTIPNAKGNTYVADLRMMLSSTEKGLRPLCVYARRAAKPLMDTLDSGESSWDMLGTNLSLKKTDGGWDSDTTRLMLTDRRDFNKLGMGLDDIIEGYIQTVLSTIAIDQMCIKLMTKQGKFRSRLFKSLNDDQSLIKEIKLE